MTCTASRVQCSLLKKYWSSADISEFRSLDLESIFCRTSRCLAGHFASASSIGEAGAAPPDLARGFGRYALRDNRLVAHLFEKLLHLLLGELLLEHLFENLL
jgi:hypothetical protein